MSFVTAAIEYFSLNALQSASINAVLPDPTGLKDKLGSTHPGESISPANTDSKSSLGPVSAFNNRGLSGKIGPRTVKNLVGVAVVLSGGVRVAGIVGMGMTSVVRVRHGNRERWR